MGANKPEKKPCCNNKGRILMKGLSQGLGLNLTLLYWIFKLKLWRSPFVNTEPESYKFYNWGTNWCKNKFVAYM